MCVTAVCASLNVWNCRWSSWINWNSTRPQQERVSQQKMESWGSCPRSSTRLPYRCVCEREREREWEVGKIFLRALNLINRLCLIKGKNLKMSQNISWFIAIYCPQNSFFLNYFYLPFITFTRWIIYIFCSFTNKIYYITFFFYIRFFSPETIFKFISTHLNKTQRCSVLHDRKQQIPSLKTLK